MKRAVITVIAVTSLFALASCGDEELAPVCTTSTDCDDGMLCHPHSGTCVESCAESASVCTGTETPLCRTQDGDPLENFCICDASSNSCGIGRECNPTTGLCQNEGGGPGPGTCTTGATGGQCGADEVCVGGNTCEPICENASCLNQGMICNPVIAESAFNQCSDPDMTPVCTDGCFATCPDRGDHRRDTNGPIIYDITFSGDFGSTPNCAAPALAQRFQLLVHSEAGIMSNDVFREVIRRLASGNENNVFSEGPSSSTHPTVQPRGNNNFEVTFFLCNDPGVNRIFSVFVRDNAGRDSNAICFRPTSM